jgi:choline dehydrogenase-like flavoprotein
MSKVEADTDRTPSSRADLCIVGAGVAGALVADALAADGHEVVMLDAGPRFDPTDRLEQMEMALRNDVDDEAVWAMGGPRDAYTEAEGTTYRLNDARVKGVGGSTLHWAGFTPRYHEKDFEMRSRYGLAEDWPIDYADLEPYYALAERELGVAGAEDNPFSPPRSTDFPLPAFPGTPIDERLEAAAESVGVTLHSAPQARNSEPYDGRSQCLGFGTCEPVCPSRAKYSGDVHVGKAEAGGVRVIDRAPVRRLEHDADGRIVAAVYDTPDGEGYRQAADRFVLACGGVEIPRLLLLSASPAYPDGLANTSGLVGRYFMEHYAASATGVVDRPPGQEPMWWWSKESHQFYDHDPGDPGSVKIEFNHRPLNGPLSTVTGTSDLVGRLADQLTGRGWDPSAAEAAARETRDEWRVTVTGLGEMLPHRENRVTLDPERTDDRGVPVPRLRIEPDDHVREALANLQSVGREVLEAMGAREVSTSGLSNPAYGYHHMGTTRMGTDPATSVVDADCRTHDHENLYVASSSVFTTGGAMNPTLTIAALALRLADHLREAPG